MSSHHDWGIEGEHWFGGTPDDDFRNECRECGRFFYSSRQDNICIPCEHLTAIDDDSIFLEIDGNEIGPLCEQCLDAKDLCEECRKKPICDEAQYECLCKECFDRFEESQLSGGSNP